MDAEALSAILFFVLAVAFVYMLLNCFMGVKGADGKRHGLFSKHRHGGGYDSDDGVEGGDDEASTWDGGADYDGGRSAPRIFTRDPWFEEIAAGRKTIEVRVGALDKFSQLAGQNVIVLGGPGKKAKATIESVVHYDTLEALLTKEGYKNVAPQTSSAAAAKTALLELTNKAGEVIYSPDRVKEKGGVCALVVKLSK